MQKNRNTIQPQSRLPSLRFTMRTYCRTPVEKECFDLSVRQVLRKSQSATLSTAYCMVFLFSRSLCQRKIWMLAVYAGKVPDTKENMGLTISAKRDVKNSIEFFTSPFFHVIFCIFYGK